MKKQIHNCLRKFLHINLAFKYNFSKGIGRYQIISLIVKYKTFIAPIQAHMANSIKSEKEILFFTIQNNVNKVISLMYYMELITKDRT